MSTLVNKLVIAAFRMSEQYSCCIKETDFKMKCLIQMLSLQVIIQLKIRLIADNLVSFRKTVFFDNFTKKIVFFDNFIRKSTFFNNLNVRKKKFSILNLIKNAQEFDSLCR